MIRDPGAVISSPVSAERRPIDPGADGGVPETPIIVWFRRELRVSDNPAFAAAVESARPVIPVFILETDPGNPWPLGEASRWWLHQSLAALAASLATLGLPLVLRRGNAGATLAALAAETGARAVFWNQSLEPWPCVQDRGVAEHLGGCGCGAALFSATLLFDPASLKSGSGQPYGMFLPFWRRCLGLPSPGRPLPAPSGTIRAPASPPPGDALEAWGLPGVCADRWSGFAALWSPGEAGAQERLTAFLAGAATDYRQSRDRLDWPGTSRLSPHLCWGEISARQIWSAVHHRLDRGAGDASLHAFLRQLGWREFSAYLLHHYPDLPTRSLNRRFIAFPWHSSAAALAAWQEGRTGYPIVDAGMRQLRETGWIHNRMRMVVASFLTKHLLLPWQEGAAWFHATLVDADLANNSVSWQWVSGCGVDAAPFFRIFNPTLQGQQFDPQGSLIRRFVPELAGLSAPHIHDPAHAPAEVLTRAGISLGVTYPKPIIEHGQARARAMAAFHSLPS